MIAAISFLLLNTIPITFAAVGPFTIQSAQWGTSAKPVEVQPGSIDVPLTVAIQFTGGLEARSVVGVLYLAAAALNKQVVGGFADAYGNTTTSASAVAVVPDSAFTLSYSIDIAATTATGTYTIPLALEWTNSSGNSGYYVQDTSISLDLAGIPLIIVGTSQTALAPGSVNNASLIVSNRGSGEASQIEISLSAPGATVLAPPQEIVSLGPGQSETLEVGLYVPEQASGSAISLDVAASYYDSYGNPQTTNQAVGMYVGTASSPVLSFQLGGSSLAPGQATQVPLTLTNLGKGGASGIRTLISSSSQVSVLSQFPFVADLNPGSSVTSDISLYVSPNAAGLPLSLTLTSSYTDQYGQSETSTQVLGLYVVNTNSTLASSLISVVPLRNEINVGSQSIVSFLVKNIGVSNLTSPVLSLSVSSPLVVTANSSYVPKESVFRPGESITYNAAVAAGTSSTPGYYTATLTLNYIDQSGGRESTTVSAGLVLSGTIILTVQDTQVAQGNTTLVVSGSILNKGFSNAYYATVTGSLAGTRGSSSPDYVGEVDTNTLVPFSVTINYTPQARASRANVTVSITYEDSLGAARQYTTTIPTTLESASQLLGSQSSTSSTSTSGSDLLSYLEYVVVLVLAVIAIVGGIYVRRNRRATGSGEGKSKSESEVI